MTKNNQSITKRDAFDNEELVQADHREVHEEEVKANGARSGAHDYIEVLVASVN